ncbi:uncharacterized protein KD926_001634 [Aspergillus affinis]|uniref:uncharacterized protein n=1 Tax=Aspergillus affinis TaxID=1070780 RepID=UPI0022FDB36A|nr:uncharacterized protein KD926_001634 [Aspergillus affinis]KAI9036621.1 hypothetical protein KD926_001634 [Aspergillus affinis]
MNPLRSLTLSTSLSVNMHGVQLSTTSPFVYALFGIQLPNNNNDDATTTSEKTTLITQFDNLLCTHPAHTDHIVQDNTTSLPTREGESQCGKTRIWLTYWTTSQDYQAWWLSPSVQQFWSNLPDDAGVWREVMTLPASRTQHGTNCPEVAGMGHLGPRNSVADKSGYWGCYRQRLTATTVEKDPLNSTFPLGKDQEKERRCPYSGSNETSTSNSTGTEAAEDRSHSKGIVIPDEKVPSKTHPGRVLITNIPDNICFVVEGQDHTTLTPSERDLWFKCYDSLTTQWFKDLLLSTNSNTATLFSDTGPINTRFCYDPSSEKYRHETTIPSLNYNRKIQLFYFRDLEALERIGRQNLGHVKLRKTFLGAYGPGGEMFGVGNLGLWVETSVVKNGEMECEQNDYGHNSFLHCHPSLGAIWAHWKPQFKLLTSWIHLPPE